MQLSYHADYACRVLIYLATMKADRCSIQTISDAFKISENHLVKVVHKLGKLGFIITVRGNGGGIYLKTKPSEITIGDVIRSMEQNFDVVECFSQSNNTCPITPVCRLKSAIATARDAFLSSLDQVTLAEVTGNRKALGRIMELSKAGA